MWWRWSTGKKRKPGPPESAESLRMRAESMEMPHWVVCYPARHDTGDWIRRTGGRVKTWSSPTRSTVLPDSPAGLAGGFSGNVAWVEGWKNRMSRARLVEKDYMTHWRCEQRGRKGHIRWSASACRAVRVGPGYGAEEGGGKIRSQLPGLLVWVLYWFPTHCWTTLNI